jgi:aspartyl-tRNA(Asn)/glutamyl-tRNA(Gln) amidotransferase subunit C
MTALSREDVLEIARLARLHLEDDEAERLGGELSAILDHMQTLAEVDTDGIEPMTHAVPMQLRLRDDEPGTPLPVEAALGQAPDRADDYFQVPHILGRARTSGGDPPR